MVSTELQCHCLQSESRAPTGHPSAWISLSSFASLLAEIEAISEGVCGECSFVFGGEGRGKSEVLYNSTDTKSNNLSSPFGLE